VNAPGRIEELLTATKAAFLDGSLVQLKLGGYHGDEPDLKAVLVKKISTKAGEKYSFTWRYKTRDTIKNSPKTRRWRCCAMAFKTRSAARSWRPRGST
jgi:hypothetical protein